MQFKQAVESAIRNWDKYSGRASRSEYWYYQLAVFLVMILIGILDVPFISLLFSLAASTVCLSMAVRRMHDIDRSGWWVLIFLVPIVGIILHIIWFCTKGTNGPNRFGADPLASQAVAE